MDDFRQDSALAARVQRLQIVANRRVDDLLAGQYKSVFRGRGMEFDEVRQYQPGDDIRDIDWNVTARQGEPFIKRFCEERELTIMFLVDVSASGMFGSSDQSKLDTMTEMAAVLMFSALKNNDKVGMITFADEVLEYYPPRKGKSHVLSLIRTLVTLQPVRKPTNIDAAVEYLSRVLKRKAVAFLISDLGGELSTRSLRICNRRHDLVALKVEDERELAIPDVGFVVLEDAETGRQIELDASNPEIRRLFAQNAQNRREEITGKLKKSKIDQLDITTRSDYIQSLRQFFDMREKRVR